MGILAGGEGENSHPSGQSAAISSPQQHVDACAPRELRDGKEGGREVEWWVTTAALTRLVQLARPPEPARMDRLQARRAARHLRLQFSPECRLSDGREMDNSEATEGMPESREPTSRRGYRRRQSEGSPHFAFERV